MYILAKYIHNIRRRDDVERKKIRAASRNGNEVVVLIITRFNKC